MAAPDLAEADASAHAHECWDLLAALQMLRAQLWLGAVGASSAGLSVILALHPQDGSLTIDALRQAEALGEGEPVYFDTQVEGRRLRFDARLDRLVQHDGAPAYRLRDVRLVLDQQRRSAYRVRVPPNVRIPAALGEPGQQVPARLLDLSTRGCATRVESAANLEPGDPVRVHLRLTPADLHCDAWVRNVQRTHGAYRIGIEFEIDPRVDGAALDQAVARLQREILRRRSGQGTS